MIKLTKIPSIEELKLQTREEVIENLRNRGFTQKFETESLDYLQCVEMWYDYNYGNKNLNN